MKRIVIITDRKRIAEKSGRICSAFFRGKAELETLTFEEIAKMETVDGDLLLFTLGDRIERIKEKLLHLENIVVIRRTIREKNLVKLFEIPQGTPVLVVNDNYENTLQTVNLLYDLNVDNLNFKAMERDRMQRRHHHRCYSLGKLNAFLPLLSGSLISETAASIWPPLWTLSTGSSWATRKSQSAFCPIPTES